LFLRDFAAIARRRWILVLVGIVMSAGMAVGGWFVASPTYQITAAVLLLPPNSTVPEEGNPLLQLGGLDVSVDLLSKSLTDQQVTKDVEAIAPNAEFEIGADPNSSAPILRIQVRDKSGSTAERIRDMLVGMVPSRLRQIQDAVGVTAKNRVTTSVLVSDNTAEPVGRDKLQAAVIGGAAGVVLWTVLIVLIDGAILRRGRRTARAAASGAGAAEPDAAVSPDTEAGPVAAGDGPSGEDSPVSRSALGPDATDAPSEAEPTRHRHRVRGRRAASGAVQDQEASVPADPPTTGEEPARVEAEL
jgi:capsular polysaccharide biosynthesis protein